MNAHRKDERVGKAKNREYDSEFFNSIQKFHGAKVAKVLVDGDHAATLNACQGLARK